MDLSPEQANSLIRSAIRNGYSKSTYLNSINLSSGETQGFAISKGLGGTFFIDDDHAAVVAALMPEGVGIFYEEDSLFYSTGKDDFPVVGTAQELLVLLHENFPTGERVRLSEVAPICGLSDGVLDEWLGILELSEEIVLMGINDPQDVRSDDWVSSTGRQLMYLIG